MVQSSSEVLSAPVSVYLLAENRLLRETLARLLAKRGGLSIAGVSPYTESMVERIFASGCAILLMDSLATKQGTTLLATCQSGSGNGRHPVRNGRRDRCSSGPPISESAATCCRKRSFGDRRRCFGGGAGRAPGPRVYAWRWATTCPARAGTGQGSPCWPEASSIV